MHGTNQQNVEIAGRRKRMHMCAEVPEHTTTVNFPALQWRIYSQRITTAKLVSLT